MCVRQIARKHPHLKRSFFLPFISWAFLCFLFFFFLVLGCVGQNKVCKVGFLCVCACAHKSCAHTLSTFRVMGTCLLAHISASLSFFLSASLTRSFFYLYRCLSLFFFCLPLVHSFFCLFLSQPLLFFNLSLLVAISFYHSLSHTFLSSQKSRRQSSSCLILADLTGSRPRY